MNIRILIWSASVALAVANVTLAQGLNGDSLIPAFDSDGVENRRAESTVKQTTFQKILDATRPTKLVRKRQGPTMLSKMNDGTKRFMTKTKDAMIAPWKKLSASKSKSRSSASRKASLKARKRREKKSFLPSFFVKGDRAKPPSTVGEFISSPRP